MLPFTEATANKKLVPVLIFRKKSNSAAVAKERELGMSAVFSFIMIGSNW